MGLIHLDAGVLIGLLDSNDAHHDAATDALSAAQRAGDRLAMAASAFAECLVGPSRRGARAVAVVQALFHRLPIEIVELDADTALAAAALRARHRSLRLPDALVLATAARQSVDELITTDRRWPTSRRLGLDFTITLL
ncbi:MAG: type II toxin-antitoxin system VapC family toxin [Acidimicrobiia bacterium]